MVLLSRVGQLLCAFPVEHVVETLRPLCTEPLGVGHFVAGVAIVRGAPIPVIDAAAALGQRTAESASAASARRWIVLRLGARRAAMAVDAIVGVRPVERKRFAELDPLITSSADPVDALGALDRELLLVLSAARLVPPAVFTALDEARA